MKTLQFADFIYEGQLEKQLALIDGSIQTVKAQTNSSERLLLGLLHLRKANLIRIADKDTFYEEMKKSMNESLRILEQIKDESLIAKLHYYYACSVLVQIESQFTSAVIVADPKQLIDDILARMEAENLQNFIVYSFTLQTQGLFINSPRNLDKDYRQAIRYTKQSISLQPNHLLNLSNSYYFLHLYMKKVQKKKNLQFAATYLRKALITYKSIFSMDAPFIKLCIDGYQELAPAYDEEYLLFPFVYGLLKQNQYQKVLDYLEIAELISGPERRFFYQQLISAYRAYSVKRAGTDWTEERDLLLGILAQLKALSLQSMCCTEKFNQFIVFERGRFVSKLAKCYANQHLTESALETLQSYIFEVTYPTEQTILNL